MLSLIRLLNVFEHWLFINLFSLASVLSHQNKEMLKEKKGRQFCKTSNSVGLFGTTLKCCRFFIFIFFIYFRSNSHVEETVSKTVAFVSTLMRVGDVTLLKR